MNKTQLLQKRNSLLDKREKLISRMNAAARAGKNPSRACAELRRVNEFLETLDRIEADNTGRPNTGPRRYTMSSIFLHDSFSKLTADRSEQFFFITGTELEGVLVCDQWAEFAHERRTPMGVVADVPSTHNLLIRLEQFGHKFLAHFHSHPAVGADGTKPSGIDTDFQKRLEDAGHLAVMGIFSRDGFVRFIRLDQNFEIEIYGQGVESYAPGIYRLTNLD